MFLQSVKIGLNFLEFSFAFFIFNVQKIGVGRVCGGERNKGWIVL